MYTIFFIIGFIIALTIALAKFLETWLKDDEKKQLKRRLEEVWVKLDDFNPKLVAQSPLRLLNFLHDTVFGQAIFSKKAYMRTGIISMIVLLCWLGITGLFMEVPFAIKTPPWELFNKLNKIGIENILELKEDSKLSHKYTEEDKQRVIEKYSFLSSTGFVVGHSIVFILLTLLLNAFFDATSLALTRLMLKEIIKTDSLILMVCVLATNLLVAILLSSFTMLLVFIVYYPLMVPILAIVPKLLIDYPSFTIIGVFAATIGAWSLGGTWLKIIAVTTVLPILILCVSLLASLILFPLRNHIHAWSNRVLLNAIEYEKGFLAFSILFLGSIGGFIGIIVVCF